MKYSLIGTDIIQDKIRDCHACKIAGQDGDVCQWNEKQGKQEQAAVMLPDTFFLYEEPTAEHTCQENGLSVIRGMKGRDQTKNFKYSDDRK